MLIIAYDISNDSLRGKFSRFLKKHGRKIQYSVVEIQNSPRVLRVIMAELDKKFKPKFCMADSVIIFPISEADSVKVVRIGWSVQEEKSFV
jgi:CRISPR-associated protein Cas2